MGELRRIWIKRAYRGPMDEQSHATLVAGRGIAGNANQGGRRQVTIIDEARWTELMVEVGATAAPGARRANLLVRGLDLIATRGRVLRIGTVKLRILGETRPCEQMDDVWPGLQEAMRHRWGGGVFAEVLEGGEIAIGDRVELLPRQLPTPNSLR
jgi:MOSC domain-containing protein YiiM